MGSGALWGKVALVTGAGSGIGRASAIALGEQGASVGLLGRTSEELEMTAVEISRGHGKACPLTADVSDENQTRRAIATLIEKYGRLDILVANAGINGVWAPIDDLKPEEWDTTLAVNLRGTYLTVHFAVPHLKIRGGSIIIVSSINGTRTFTSPGATAYAVSKAGQVAMTKQLALELARHRIRVNAVCPGEIETNINSTMDVRSEDETQIPVVWPEGQVPITGGRPGTAGDVAEVVLFLASDRSKHITGSPIWVDGGQGLLR
ncbi:SDR family oxidoreductase [Mycoplana rhizolycopersici]|uniref:SDR family oxidoreductase n=1 Tax=Mycoplana rhizolycopersici TaxID=2746702 RepID=A0ABX2QKL1_9HYPH|nr:SDR family NAD(P)-dependent oxidoreductase [Rhizobium rhizolycopersici]NVP58341.1 SDR family oxidoreductase [Rhizobium rhizolycopersici]